MDIFEMPVHPAAEVFPMLDEEDLNNLAEDIKQNGLIHPLVTKDGILIDGRNRREACRRAGVIPKVIELNGADPATYIISSNIARRHMTKSQQAMAVAMIYPEPGEKGRGKKDEGRKWAENDHFAVTLLKQARLVLKWASELADAILRSAKSLDEAYKTAQQRAREADSIVARMAKLKAEDPDLAELVSEGKLTLVDAEAAARKRRETERAQRQGVYDGLQRFKPFAVLVHGENGKYLVELCRKYPKEIDSEELLTLIQTLLIDLKQVEENLK